VLSDIDGDGRADLITAPAGAGALLVFLSLGTAGGEIRFAPPVSLPLPAGAFAAVAVGDLNGDLAPDLVAVNASDGSLSVFLSVP
jgi:hypothetical protein